MLLRMYQWDVRVKGLARRASVDSQGLRIDGVTFGWFAISTIAFPTLMSVRVQTDDARQLDVEFESRAATMAFGAAASASGARSISNFEAAFALLQLSYSATARPDDLLRASGAGDTAQICALLDAGADINGADIDGDSALYYAASRGHSESVASLLKRGANPNLVGTGTALSAAAAAGNTQVVQLLLAGGADPEKRLRADGRPGFTALMLAAGAAQDEVVRMLAASGADINATDDDGDSVLFYAVSRGRLRTARLLLTLGADASPKPGGNNHTPLTVAVMDAFTNGVVRGAVNVAPATDMIRLLLGHGSDASPVFRGGFSFFLGEQRRPHFIEPGELRRAVQEDTLGIWYG